MDTKWADWVIPAISWAGLVLWLPVIRLRLGRNQKDVPADVRRSYWWALASVLMVIAFSSLVYPGLVDADTSRFLFLLLRIELLILGIVAWLALPHRWLRLD